MASFIARALASAACAVLSQPSSFSLLHCNVNQSAHSTQPPALLVPMATAAPVHVPIASAAPVASAALAGSCVHYDTSVEHTETRDPVFGSSPGSAWHAARSGALSWLRYVLRVYRFGHVDDADVCHGMSPSLSALYWSAHAGECAGVLSRHLQFDAEVTFHVLMALTTALVCALCVNAAAKACCSGECLCFPCRRRAQYVALPGYAAPPPRRAARVEDEAAGRAMTAAQTRDLQAMLHSIYVQSAVDEARSEEAAAE